MPSRPLIGTKDIFSALNPICFKKGSTWALISSYLSYAHATISSLFIATRIYVTPKLLARIACSLVPPPVKPLSKEPIVESITKIAQSAYAAPLIIFGTKSLCPGASKIVNYLFSVSK